MLPIRFSYQNSLKENVGDHGLAQEDFNDRAALDALQAFRARVDRGDVGFPTLPLDSNGAKQIEKFAAGLHGDLDAILILGIGGSALGPYAIDTALRGPHPVQLLEKKSPRLFVMDNIDPGYCAAILSQINPKRVAVCVIAKSGGTAETISTFMITYEWLTKAVGTKKAQKRIIAITDPQKGDLLQIAKNEKFTTFYIPGNVGGRFSVFTPVGLVPAALCGIDIHKILRGAREANQYCWSRDLSENLAMQSAMIHYLLDTRRQKKTEIVFAYSNYLWGAAFWYRQLWAESIGKRVNRRGEIVNTGQTPVAALGVTDQHSQMQLYAEGPHDKMLTFWTVQRHRSELEIPASKTFAKYESATYLQKKKLAELFHAEQRATESALTHLGRPNCRWTLPKVDEYHLGMFFQLLEFQTAFTAELLGIDAFDQPGVELAKKLTNGLMGRKGFEEYAEKAPAGRPFLVEAAP
jgi:glucose-6-phosphate isomerase